MTDRLRLGIVGCGEATQLIHLPTLRDLRDRLKVTALCDISRRVLEGVGEEWNIARRHLDYHTLVADPEIDAVLVANPHALHAEVALAAMTAGKAVFIEKPMCLTLAEADALIAEQKRSGVTVQIGYMRRYAPAFIAACDLVKEMPDIRLVRVQNILGRNALINAQIANVIRSTDLAPALGEQLRKLQTERVREAIGAAPPALDNAYMLLLALCSHDLSAMREMLGFPGRVLFATHRGPEGRSIAAAFDYGSFVCQFATEVDNLPRFDAHIEVLSPSRIVRVNFDTPYVRNMPGRLHVTDLDDAGMARSASSLAWRDPFVLEWIAFHENVTQRKQPKTSLQDAREDLVLFKMMVDAMRAAQPS